MSVEAGMCGHGIDGCGCDTEMLAEIESLRATVAELRKAASDVLALQRGACDAQEWAELPPCWHRLDALCIGGS